MTRLVVVGISNVVLSCTRLMGNNAEHNIELLLHGQDAQQLLPLLILVATYIHTDTKINALTLQAHKHNTVVCTLQNVMASHWFIHESDAVSPAAGQTCHA